MVNCADITLGTLYDKYHDVAAARKASADDGDADLNLPPLCEVLHWGIGEVGLKDVNLASAGDGEKYIINIYLFTVHQLPQQRQQYYNTFTIPLSTF